MSEIIQILQSHSPQNGDVQVILFQGFAEVQNGRHGSISFFFEVAKILSRKLFKFYNHIPHEMCMWFFQGFKEIQNGRHAWTS